MSRTANLMQAPMTANFVDYSNTHPATEAVYERDLDAIEKYEALHQEAGV